MEKKKRKLPRVVTILITVCVVLLAIPLLLAGLSFIGRISADEVIPDGYMGYASVPNPATATAHLMDHSGLETLLADPVLSPVAPTVTGLRKTRIMNNLLVRLVLNNPVTAAAYTDGSVIACYDTGILSRAAILTPALLSRMDIRGLYYVKAGKYSRFELRPEGEPVLFAGFYKNLLVASNNRELFESVLDGTSAGNVAPENRKKTFSTKKYDAAMLIDANMILSTAVPDNTEMHDLLSTVSVPRIAEAAVSIENEKMDIQITLPVSSQDPALQTLISRPSSIPSTVDFLPDTAQYATVLSVGSLKEIIAVARTVKGAQMDELLDTAESSSKMLVNLTLDELLYSWTDGEFSVFGLENRPNPVFSVKISDESMRKEVFEALTASIALTHDDSVVLNGVRIPSIRVPSFILSLLRIWDITVPTQFYMVENDFLYFSQSPENLLDTVRSIRNNTTLVRSDVWKDLSRDIDDRSSLSLFYSLDRSIPFFLRGNSDLQRILKSYGRGLAGLRIREDAVVLSLSVLAGEPSGILTVPGYPVEIGGQAENRVSVVTFKKKNEKRIVLALKDNTVLSIDPQTGKRFTFTEDSRISILTDQDLLPETADDPALWVVTERGKVSLLTGNLEPVQGFPISTGARPSSAPQSFNATLYIPDQDTSLRVVTKDGATETISMPCSDVLRAPPSFLENSGNTYIGVYPKGFFAELWLMNETGVPYTGWPVSVSGIAFGSPTLFTADGELFAAFITQAGELTIFTERGSLKQGFPASLSGVFYAQPVFSGNSLWALSADGRLYRIELDGSYRWIDIPGFAAENAVIQMYDTNGDGSDEIFVTGDANALFGFTADMRNIDGFPLPAWGTPWFGDINGDGIINCFAVGMDNRLYAWQLR